MSLSEQLIAELTREAMTTKKLLERVPNDRLEWRPHTKSMTLGELALHIAVIPRAITELASELSRELPRRPLPQPASTEEIVQALDSSIAAATGKIETWSDSDLLATWRMIHEGKATLEIPRIGVLRTILLNHWYHHRGQLTVYLRLLDVPLPAVYGSSADDNPFA